MSQVDEKYTELLKKFGESKSMVLSTAWKDKVTSRMMSIIILDGKFYFQTDIKFRKYEQIKNNPNVSLCIDNVQIEGICEEIGNPKDNQRFIDAYKKHFYYSWERYSLLSNEKLFVIKPTYIQLWVYENNKPFVEIFDVIKQQYKKIEYKV